MLKRIFVVVVWLCGAAILANLAVWQVNRLKWKTDILAQIAAEQADTNAATHDLNPDLSAPAIMYKRGVLRGHFAKNAEIILVGPRNLGDDNGLSQIAVVPFVTTNKQTIFVALGSAPYGAPKPNLPAFKITLTGALRAPETAGGFAPQNNPQQNIWKRLVVNDFIAHYQTDPATTSPYLFYVETGFGKTTLTPLNSVPALRNTHLQYAIFWAILAALWVVLMGMWLVKPAFIIGAKNPE